MVGPSMMKKERAGLVSCAHCGSGWTPLIEVPDLDPPRLICSSCVAALVQFQQRTQEDQAKQTEFDGVPVWMAFVAMGVGVFLGVALTLAFRA